MLYLKGPLLSLQSLSEKRHELFVERTAAGGDFDGQIRPPIRVAVCAAGDESLHDELADHLLSWLTDFVPELMADQLDGLPPLAIVVAVPGVPSNQEELVALQQITKVFKRLIELFPLFLVSALHGSSPLRRIPENDDAHADGRHDEQQSAEPELKAMQLSHTSVLKFCRPRGSGRILSNLQQASWPILAAEAAGFSGTYVKVATEKLRLLTSGQIPEQRTSESAISGTSSAC